MLEQNTRRLIRFRLCDHKKHVLETYNKLLILLNGNLERLLGRGKEDEVFDELAENVRVLIRDIDGLFDSAGKDYFVTLDKEENPDGRTEKD